PGAFPLMTRELGTLSRHPLLRDAPQQTSLPRSPTTALHTRADLSKKMLCTKVHTSRAHAVHKSTHLQKGFCIRIRHVLFDRVFSERTEKAIHVFSETTWVLSGGQARRNCH